MCVLYVCAIYVCAIHVCAIPVCAIHVCVLYMCAIHLCAIQVHAICMHRCYERVRDWHHNSKLNPGSEFFLHDFRENMSLTASRCIAVSISS